MPPIEFVLHFHERIPVQSCLACGAQFVPFYDEDYYCPDCVIAEYDLLIGWLDIVVGDNDDNT